MLDGQQTTLRARLRAETAGNHARVDALFSTLDLTKPAPLGRFLAAHQAGFAAMAATPADAAGGIGREMLKRMIDALDADLAHLAHTAPSLDTDPISEEAIDHIVLGSRLGTAVLRRQWSQSDDAQARGAARYFSLPGCTDAWRAHTIRLSSRSADGPSADTLIRDTKSLFDLFERAFHGVT